jgi:hypothetical protein
MKIEYIFTTLLINMVWVVFLLLALPAKADIYMLPQQQWQNPIENNPLMDNLRANQEMQIEQQKLQVMQEQAMRQDLQRIQEQQFIINQQSNRYGYE